MYQPVPPQEFTHRPSPRSPGSPHQMHRGRGGPQRFDRSPHPGRSGGKGLGYRGGGSSPGKRLGPEWFFHKSMLQDPWKNLTPVLWKGVDFPVIGSDAPESSSSWMAKSIQTRKPRVTED
ncbi:hypothetical protein MLD38_000996 [Melastoma candidum]|uniref:Uncharacterized protein n=1 Tax=Melastoma candidum TaxID=119954 RepID=A0ACB9SBW7_9MYRT|nr:hypothetical protein MLD38_000996 [Melastoma candidum]